MNPITDMFNIIRNAQAVFRPTAAVPFSNLKYEIAKILEEQGFIKKVEKKGRVPKRIILIHLKYEKTSEVGSEEKKPAISGIKMISKPGKRIYKRVKDIKPVRGGYGIAIISTSQGLMTDKEARKRKLGGEIICEVW